MKMALVALLGAGLFLLAAVFGVGSTRTPPSGSPEFVLAAGGSNPAAPSQPAATALNPSPDAASPALSQPTSAALPEVQSVGRSVQQSSVTKLLASGGSTGQPGQTSSGGSVEAAGPITVPATGGSSESGPTQAPPAQPVVGPSPSPDTGAHTVPVPAPTQTTAPLGGLLGKLLNPSPKPSPSGAPTSTVSPAPTSSP